MSRPSSKMRATNRPRLGRRVLPDSSASLPAAIRVAHHTYRPQQRQEASLNQHSSARRGYPSRLSELSTSDRDMAFESPVRVARSGRDSIWRRIAPAESSRIARPASLLTAETSAASLQAASPLFRDTARGDVTQMRQNKQMPPKSVRACILHR